LGAAQELAAEHHYGVYWIQSITIKVLCLIRTLMINSYLVGLESKVAAADRKVGAAG